MIADPAFYAVAVPAALLMGISKSGFGAGFGALATPLMALAVLLGTLVGTLLFGVLKGPAVAGIVGVMTLAFVALRVLLPPHADAAPPPRWLGVLLATVPGLTSFVAHAGGPSKWIPYAWLGLLDKQNFSTSLALMPLAPLGVWLGVGFVRRVEPALFYRLFTLGMLLTGSKLLWDALR